MMNNHLVLSAAALVASTLLWGCAPPPNVEPGSAADPIAEAYERALAAQVDPVEAGMFYEDVPTEEPVEQIPVQAPEDVPEDVRAEIADEAISEIMPTVDDLRSQLARMEERLADAESKQAEQPVKYSPELPEGVGSITLHITDETEAGWPREWFRSQPPKFRAQGWRVSWEKHANEDIPAAYLEIVVNGETFTINEPITVDDLAAAESGKATTLPAEAECGNVLCLCHECDCKNCGDGCQCSPEGGR